MSGILSISSPINDLQQNVAAEYGVSGTAPIRSAAKNVNAEDAAIDAAMIRELANNQQVNERLSVRRRIARQQEDERHKRFAQHERQSHSFYVPTNERLEDEDKPTIDSYA
jgi:hypothetical protein